jgi:hypothetical protein
MKWPFNPVLRIHEECRVPKGLMVSVWVPERTQRERGAHTNTIRRPVVPSN